MGTSKESKCGVHTAVCEHMGAGSTHPWIFDSECSHGTAAPQGNITTDICSPCGGLLAHACAHTAVCVLMKDVASLAYTDRLCTYHQTVPTF